MPPPRKAKLATRRKGRGWTSQGGGLSLFQTPRYGTGTLSQPDSPQPATPNPDPDRVARDTLRLAGPDPENWVPSRPGVNHDVAVIGGGQSGLAFAFALRRAGIGRITVIDAAPEPTETGIWRTRARMRQLRTPKTLVGPELSLPGLGFQAWYEARRGAAAYAALARIAREDWADYLDWFRRFLDIEIRYGTRLAKLVPGRDALTLRLATPAGVREETVRKVILATGFAGSGGPVLPREIASLPPAFAAHTSEAIDFAALEGRVVAVIGASASAFDAAAVAIEAGAREVRLFARRDHLAALPVTRTRAYPGAYDNYADLPDEIRWRQALRFARAGSTAPPDAVERATRKPNFHLYLDAPLREARVVDGRVVINAGGEIHRVDFVIAGTGYRADPLLRPELAEIAPDILRWRDRFLPGEGEENERLGAHPYLGTAHEYLERVPGAAPWLANVHAFNPQGLVSFGLPIGDVPSLRRDVPKVVARISRDLFLADLAQHEARLFADVAPDFDPDLYLPAARRPPAVAAE